MDFLRESGASPGGTGWQRVFPAPKSTLSSLQQQLSQEMPLQESRPDLGGSPPSVPASNGFVSGLGGFTEKAPSLGLGGPGGSRGPATGWDWGRHQRQVRGRDTLRR